MRFSRKFPLVYRDEKAENHALLFSKIIDHLYALSKIEGIPNSEFLNWADNQGISNEGEYYEVDDALVTLVMLSNKEIS